MGETEILGTMFIKIPVYFEVKASLNPDDTSLLISTLQKHLTDVLFTNVPKIAKFNIEHLGKDIRVELRQQSDVRKVITFSQASPVPEKEI